MSILIVGGAGYVGSQTAKAAAAAAARLAPVVFDNLVYGHRWEVKWGPLVEGDLADTALVKRVIEEHRVTAVIHFAAYACVGESVTHPAQVPPQQRRRYAEPSGRHAGRRRARHRVLVDARGLRVSGPRPDHRDGGEEAGQPVRQVIAAVEKVSGRKVPVNETGRRAGDPAELVADARLASSILGWKPRLPAIETIVEHAWRWRNQKRDAAR